MKKTFVCANCGEMVTEYPATRRSDSVTEICSMCAQQEALNDFFKRSSK